MRKARTARSRDKCVRSQPGTGGHMVPTRYACKPGFQKISFPGSSQFSLAAATGDRQFQSPARGHTLPRWPEDQGRGSRATAGYTAHAPPVARALAPNADQFQRVALSHSHVRSNVATTLMSPLPTTRRGSSKALSMFAFACLSAASTTVRFWA